MSDGYLSAAVCSIDLLLNIRGVTPGGAAGPGESFRSNAYRDEDAAALADDAVGNEGETGENGLRTTPASKSKASAPAQAAVEPRVHSVSAGVTVARGPSLPVSSPPYRHLNLRPKGQRRSGGPASPAPSPSEPPPSADSARSGSRAGSGASAAW